MKSLLRLTVALLIASPCLVAQETFTLTNDHGAAVVFVAGESGWRVGQLAAPPAPDGGWSLADRAVEIGTPEDSLLLGEDWELVEAGDTRVILEQDATPLGLRLRRVYAFGEAPNALRVETWVRAEQPGTVLALVGLLNWKIWGESFRETGQAPASFPLMGESLFAGIEHVSGEATAGGESIRLAQRPRLSVDGDWTFVATAIVGWPMPGAGLGLPDGARMRSAFLQYLDTVRIKPEGMVLHSETWWTMMPPLRESEVLADIDALRRGFHDRTGMFFDTYCLDLGWSDPQSLWQIADRQFPGGFRAINERLGALGARLGM